MIEACEPSQEEPKETTVQHPPIRLFPPLPPARASVLEQPVAHSGDAREVELDPRAESMSLECSCFQPEGSNPQTPSFLKASSGFSRRTRSRSHRAVKHAMGQCATVRASCLQVGDTRDMDPDSSAIAWLEATPVIRQSLKATANFWSVFLGKGRGVRWALRVYFAPSFF